MSQCVPSWDLDDPRNPSHLHPPSSSTAAHPQLSMSDYEVAELTWENGKLSVHGLVKPTSTPRLQAAGTLESVVDQAKLLLPSSAAAATWHHHQGGAHIVDARVPSSHLHRRLQRGGGDEDLASGIGSCDVGQGRKRARPGDTGTATAASTDDTDGFGFATTNSVTPPFNDDGNGVSGSHDTENTSFGGGGGSRPLTARNDHDSVCQSRRSLSQREIAGEEDEKITEGGTMRSTISTKRSRAAAIHNQSERKRRDRINQKMRTLQKLVPNSSKTDKASMLDEVIEYLKQLQAQIQMMSRMSSIPPMMIPVSMQQFQMSMMAQMGMGIGMMDIASLGRSGPTGISPVMPPGAFLPMIGPARAWDPSAERMQQPGGCGVMPDPFSAFVTCPPPPQQQMTMDAYQRMAVLYQQMFQQNQPTNPK